LQRSAQEIRLCRAVVVQLEDAVHALIDAGGPQVATGPLADLQAIDLLDQRLEDLALWIEALSGASIGCRADRPVQDLAAPLRLDEMRRTLTGRDGGRAAGRVDAGKGAPALSGQTEVF
jgi:hypothetical protein